MCDCEKQDENKKQDLSEKMLKTRSIIIAGEINKDMSEKVAKQLILLAADSNEPIKVFIDSPGGDVDAGFAIFDMIRFIKPRVFTIAMGLAASAGALILLAGDKESRFGLPNSNFLIHQPLSFGFRGVATDILLHAGEIDKAKKKINKIISEETGKDIETVEKDTDRDCWLSAQEAKKYGLIKKIIKSEAEIA